MTTATSAYHSSAVVYVYTDVCSVDLIPQVFKREKVPVLLNVD